MSRIKDIIVDTYYKRDIEEPLIIATHDGLFHTDDVLSTGFIELYLEFSGLKGVVVRTRNPACFDAADIVLDVGEQNEGKYFDHHQISFDLTHADGSPLASAGLVWADLGRDLIRTIIRKNFKYIEPDDWMVDSVWNKIDNRLVLHVDCSDNGVNIYTQCTVRPVDLVSVISMFNDYSYNKQTSQFQKALKLIKTVAMNFICGAISQVYDEKEILIQMHNVENRDSDILFIDRHFHLWRDIVSTRFDEFSQYQLLVYPNAKEVDEDGRRNWRITSFPSDPCNAFSIRCPAPLKWRGVPEDVLKRISGFRQLIFIHKSGFMGSVYGYKEDAYEVARAWIDHDKENEVERDTFKEVGI